MVQFVLCLAITYRLSLPGIDDPKLAKRTYQNFSANLAGFARLVVLLYKLFPAFVLFYNLPRCLQSLQSGALFKWFKWHGMSIPGTTKIRS